MTAASAQVKRYKKDSLQIKVYTTIDYKDYEPQKVGVSKVFCDYCNKAQILYLKTEAWHSTYKKRRLKDYVIKNGTAQLALYIRVEKTYFRKLKK